MIKDSHEINFDHQPRSQAISMLSIALEIEWSAGTRASTETKPGELWYHGLSESLNLYIIYMVGPSWLDSHLVSFPERVS